jgi:hypothetical protein
MPYAWFFGRKDDDKYEGFEASVAFLRDVMKKQVNFYRKFFYSAPHHGAPSPPANFVVGTL